MSLSDPARALTRLTAAFSARDPVPAGGAAAVAALAMGVAIGVKAARISRAPGALTVRLAALLDSTVPWFDADCDAFGEVLRTRRERAPDDARAAAWRGATMVPLAIAECADRARAALDALLPHCRPALRGDLEAAHELCAVAARISRRNAELNAGPAG